MKDLYEPLAIILTFVVLVTIGILIGAQQQNVSLAKKCEQLGAFVVNDVVYECQPK